jgi:hypothetical protein
MCYPKPGPRCSGHAAARLSRVRERENARRNSLDAHALGWAKFSEIADECEAEIEAAQAEYDATPAGLLELKRRVDQENSDKYPDLEYELRLKIAQDTRARALAAIGRTDEGDISHDSKQNRYTYSTLRTSLPRGGKRLKLGAQGIAESAAASEAWVTDLKPEEMEAIAWITSNGSHVVNDYLANGELKTRKDGTHEFEGRKITQEYLDEQIKLASDAIKRRDSEPVILYRGEHKYPELDNMLVSKYGDPEAYGAEVMERLGHMFKVGETYTAPRFLSSSYDPSTARGFSKQKIVFEMKSKTHGPVAALSAWHNVEREALVPPQTKFKIKDIVMKAEYEPRNEGKFTKTASDTENLNYFFVVQMEEI